MVGDEVKLDNYTVVQPDLTVIYPRDHQYLRVPPVPEDVLLIVEVADLVAGFGFKVKARLYAATGIPEYRIVDVENRCVIVHREPEGAGYLSVQVVNSGTDLSTPSLPSFRVQVEDVVPPESDPSVE